MGPVYYADLTDDEIIAADGIVVHGNGGEEYGQFIPQPPEGRAPDVGPKRLNVLVIEVDGSELQELAHRVLELRGNLAPDAQAYL
ncbi:hypothetical protein [Lacipirellula sp.]|uniref:hypothetical protein n=1 Tax=Lacipirellula sp. TaxID=2691419 RepID=UPI003D0ACCF8